MTLSLRAFSRREWLLSAAGMCALSRRLGAEDLAGSDFYPSKLSGFYYRDYSKCLPDYLAGLARKAYQERNTQLARLQSPQSIRDRQQWARKTFWELVGGQPERTPLNARVTGTFERTGYRLEKVVYESRPRVFVSANLYLPTAAKGPYPGVLFQMGHSITGKAYASYQKCCQGLARLGYVVLAFDPMGQGERIAYPDPSGTNTRLGSATDEHDVPGKQLLLLGDSSSRYQVWDAIRSLDYLASHDMVDAARLGSTGQSGGGTLTMLLACVDDRLSAAAVSSGNTENLACANFNAPGSTDDAEQDFIGSGTVAFDRWDLLYPMAPKPLLLQVSAHDFFGTYSPRYLDDGREQYARLAQLYKKLGHADKLGWRSTPLTHGLTYSLRVGIYDWFERWLKHSERPITEEPPVQPEPDRELWVGPTGNVARDFGSLRPIDLIRQSASALHRTSSPQREHGGADWMAALGVKRPADDVQLRTLAQVPLAGAQVAAAEVNTEAAVWAPGWLFTPAHASDRSALLVLDERGRNAHAHEDDLYHQLAREGRLVCAVDVRGIGDMTGEVGRGNPDYTIPHDAEEEFAWASLILGTPLLGQRVTDILAYVRALRNMPGHAGRPIAIATRGRLSVPALLAFAATPDIGSLYTTGGLVSLQSVLETEMYRQPLSNFAWNLYRWTDFPELAAQCAPRSIHLAGTVDGAGNKLSPETVRTAYSSQNVQVSADSAWDFTNLASV